MTRLHQPLLPPLDHVHLRSLCFDVERRVFIALVVHPNFEFGDFEVAARLKVCVGLAEESGPVLDRASEGAHVDEGEGLAGP